MNSLKKDEGVPLLNFEDVPVLNLGGGVPSPIFKFRGGPVVTGPAVLVTLLQHAVKFKQTNQTC